MRIELTQDGLAATQAVLKTAKATRPMRRLFLIFVAFLLVCCASLRSHANQRQDYLNRELMAAAWEGDGAQALRLLARGAQVNARSKYGQTPLLAAVEEHHVDVARLLLQHGAQVNSQTYRRPPALMTAARSSDVEMTRLLLESGANPNTGLLFGYSPMIAAGYDLPEDQEIRRLVRAAGARYGVVETTWLHNTQELRALLYQGADPNSHDASGRTALMIAAMLDEPEISYEPPPLELLLRYDADVNAVDPYGRTVLMVAAQSGAYFATDAVRALLVAGAKVEKRDRRGATALMLAAGKGKQNSVTLLMQHGADMRTRDNQGRTVLMYAADWNYPIEGAAMLNNGQAVPLLLSNGADVNARDNDSRTALYLAARNAQDDSTLNKLIAAGAQPNIADRQGVTPLMWAAYYRDTDQIKALRTAGARVGLLEALLLDDETTAKTLIANGVSVNARGLYGQTPLMIAARKGFVEIARLLLDAGADIHACDSTGDTALHGAVGAAEWWHGFILAGYHAASMTHEEEHLNLVSLLLERGASAERRNRRGETPLLWAARQGYLPTTQLLLAHGARCQGSRGALPLQEALAHHHVALARLLLQHKASPNLHGNKDFTSLHLAVSAGEAGIAQDLLEAAADTNPLTPDGDTALMLAVEKGNPGLITLLLMHGANVNAQGASGQTALIGAAYNGKLAAVQQLLAASADANIKDYDDKTALDYAHAQNHPDVVALLSAANRH